MFHPATTPPRLSTLVLFTAASTLSLNMFLPSLSNIAQTFSVGYGLVTLSIAGYLAVTAVLQLMLGPLSDRFGRRPVALISIGIFTAASLGCAMAPGIWWFLGFRACQGTIIASWTLSQAAIRDTAPPQEAASRMGYVAMAMAIAPAMGPMIGGFLDQFLGWRASFLVFAIMGAGMLWLCWSDFGETNKQPSRTMLEQFRAYPRLFRSPVFWGYAVCMAFSVSAFYAFLSGVPLVAASMMSIPPAVLGIYMGSITAGFLLGSFLSGRYAKRYALTTMVLTGRLVACTGLLCGVAAFLASHVNPMTLFGATMFVGIGNGLTMPSASAGAVSVRPQLAGSASRLSGALIVGVGAVFTSLTGTILSEQNGAHELLGVMLFCSAIALSAAALVYMVERRAKY